MLAFREEPDARVGLLFAFLLTCAYLPIGTPRLGNDLRVEPGGRKRQRNRRKGAPAPDEELMYPSIEGPFIYMLASSISALVAQAPEAATVVSAAPELPIGAFS